jgi:hypothetical protein
VIDRLGPEGGAEDVGRLSHNVGHRTRAARRACCGIPVIDSATDPLWFFWPVTFAIVAAIAVHRLLRRRAWWSAVVAVVSVAVPVLPLTLAIPIRCSDDDAVPDLRIVALGLGLLGIIGWLAILARLQERAGDTRGEAERKVLWSGALLVPGMLVEYVASAITLAVRCTGTSEPVIAHLAIAAVVFTVVAGSALLRGRVDQ